MIIIVIRLKIINECINLDKALYNNEILKNNAINNKFKGELIQKQRLK